jgi:putative chitinase
VQLTADQLQAICPASQAGLAIADLNAILISCKADSKQRVALIVAQLGVESDYFRALEEDPMSWTGKAYVPYYGRSWIQLTWKYNYKACGDAIGIDLVNHPEEAIQKNAAVCTWFWMKFNLNAFADANDCDGATRKINGQGATQASLDVRRKYYTRALNCLNGVDTQFLDVVGGSSAI